MPPLAAKSEEDKSFPRPGAIPLTQGFKRIIYQANSGCVLLKPLAFQDTSGGAGREYYHYSHRVCLRSEGLVPKYEGKSYSTLLGFGSLESVHFVHNCAQDNRAGSSVRSGSMEMHVFHISSIRRGPETSTTESYLCWPNFVHK